MLLKICIKVVILIQMMLLYCLVRLILRQHDVGRGGAVQTNTRCIALKVILCSKTIQKSENALYATCTPSKFHRCGFIPPTSYLTHRGKLCKRISSFEDNIIMQWLHVTCNMHMPASSDQSININFLLHMFDISFPHYISQNVWSC